MSAEKEDQTHQDNHADRNRLTCLSCCSVYQKDSCHKERHPGCPLPNIIHVYKLLCRRQCHKSVDYKRNSELSLVTSAKFIAKLALLVARRGPCTCYNESIVSHHIQG